MNGCRPRLQPLGRADREKVEHELWRLAQDILRLGLSVVLDFGLWARIERDEMRSAARGLGVGVELHYLDVPTDELWRRIEARNSEPPWDSYPIGRADLDEWARALPGARCCRAGLVRPPATTGLTRAQGSKASVTTARCGTSSAATDPAASNGSRTWPTGDLGVAGTGWSAGEAFGGECPAPSPEGVDRLRGDEIECDQVVDGGVPRLAVAVDVSIQLAEEGGAERCARS